MSKDIINKLCAPFPYSEVEAKIQVTTGDKTSGLAVFYINSRAIQNRLDETVGAFNWRNQFTLWHDNSQICGISILNEERGEWITKYDGAENSDIESIKGGLTDALKRAAVLWGIGRYLYQIDGVWVEIEQKGKSSVIKKNQLSKLQSAYETAVGKIFKSAPAPSSAQQPPAQTTPSATSAKEPAQAPPQQPPAPQAEKKEQETAPKPPAPDYKIKSVKPAGTTSQLVELLSRDGKTKSAYVKAGDESVAVGKFLRNVRFEEKSGSYGPYSLMTNYEMAA